MYPGFHAATGKLYKREPREERSHLGRASFVNGAVIFVDGGMTARSH